MLILDRDGRFNGDLDRDITKLRRLADDLERLRDGRRPTPHELADAPVLEDWLLAWASTSCLVGHCTNHPRLDGPNIRTSDLWVLAPRQGWARTMSRFYRLGARAARPVCN